MEQNGRIRKKEMPFTQVSNEALRNNKLSIKAKGLYAIIQSYITAPDFDLYVGHLAKVSGMGRDAFQKTWGELKEHGYLKQYRIRRPGSQKFIYEYDLLDKADLDTPAIQNIGTGGKVVSLGNGVTESPDEPHNEPQPDEPHDEQDQKIIGTEPQNLNHTGFQYGSEKSEPYGFSTRSKTNPVENQYGNNNTNSSNTEENNTNYPPQTPSIHPPVTSTGACAESDPSTDEMDMMDSYREIIQENIQYDELCAQCDTYDTDRVDELVTLVVETVCCKKTAIKLGGDKLPAAMVKSRLLKLRRDHIQYVLDCMAQNTTQIRNIRGYLLTALYNAPVTITHHYHAAANHDMTGPRPD